MRKMFRSVLIISLALTSGLSLAAHVKRQLEGCYSSENLIYTPEDDSDLECALEGPFHKKSKSSGATQDDKIESNSSDHFCSICLDEFEKDRFISKCLHSFHSECLLPWLKIDTSCPCCRSDIPRIDTLKWQFRDELLDLNAELQNVSNEAQLIYLLLRNGHVDDGLKIISIGGNSLNAAINADGDTLAHFLCQVGNLTMLNELIKQSPDINIQNNRGLTPIHLACLEGRQKILDTLIELPYANFDLKDKVGRAAIHYACGLGNLEILKSLLKANADIKIKDDEGYEPVHRACAGGHVSIVRRLVTQGANVNATMNDGRTMMHLAVRMGDLKMVNALITCGANIHAVDNNGQAVIHLVCFNDSVSILSKLYIFDREIIHTKDNKQWTPSHYACQNGCLDALKKLHELGANVHAIDDDGLAPIHIASIYGHLRVLGQLIIFGAKINEKAKDGCTPIHYACRAGHMGVSELLVKAGAVLDGPDGSGITPYESAVINGYDALGAMIKKKMDATSSLPMCLVS